VVVRLQWLACWYEIICLSTQQSVQDFGNTQDLLFLKPPANDLYSHRISIHAFWVVQLPIPSVGLISWLVWHGRNWILGCRNGTKWY